MGSKTETANGGFDLRSLGLLQGSPEPSFVNAVRLAAFVTHTPAATLAIHDHEGSEVLIRAQSGLDAPEAAPSAIPVERSLLGNITSATEVVAISDAHRDRRTEANPMIAATGARGVLAAPILCPAENVVGLLVVYDRSVRIWSNEEKDALLVIAQFCTQAILLRAALRTVRIMSRRAAPNDLDL